MLEEESRPGLLQGDLPAPRRLGLPTRECIDLLTAAQPSQEEMSDQEASEMAVSMAPPESPRALQPLLTDSRVEELDMGREENVVIPVPTTRSTGAPPTPVASQRSQRSPGVPYVGMPIPRAPTVPSSPGVRVVIGPTKYYSLQCGTMLYTWPTS